MKVKRETTRSYFLNNKGDVYALFSFSTTTLGISLLLRVVIARRNSKGVFFDSAGAAIR